MRYIYILFVIIVFDQTVSAQICVGEQGSIHWEAWQGLFDDEFSELTALEYYPSRPDVVQTLYKSRSPQNYDNYYNFSAEKHPQVYSLSYF